MEILSFDVCGKMAHFRKYYANNTAFSYSIPPRTTVMGMLGAILGYQRDGYYEKLSSAHLRVGVRVVQPIKKAFHRLNLLSIKSRGDAIDGTGDFTGAGGRIQTPFELITGINLVSDVIVYRIFIAQGVDDNGAYHSLKTALLNHKQVFNLTLGTANFSAWLTNIQVHSGVIETNTSGMVEIHSAAPSDKIGKLNFWKGDSSESDNFLEEELMPADFIGDGNRELSKLIRLIFSTQGKAFSAELNSDYFQVPGFEGGMQNILFIE